MDETNVRLEVNRPYWPTHKLDGTHSNKVRGKQIYWPFMTVIMWPVNCCVNTDEGINYSIVVISR